MSKSTTDKEQSEHSQCIISIAPQLEIGDKIDSNRSLEARIGSHARLCVFSGGLPCIPQNSRTY